MSVSVRVSVVRMCCLAAVSMLLLGCGSGTSEKLDKTYPVSGVVKYKGQPVAGATVVFNFSGAKPHTAMGQTDAEGRYKLGTYQPGDGAVEGPQAVTITKEEVVEADPKTGIVPKPKHLLPVKYTDVGTSPLTATVNAGKNENVDFNLE